jgi:DNA-directed RNA polymerase specialized sigma24 family protein
VSSANLHPDTSGYDELAAIASDPVMRRHARRLVGELAEDVLQETWYAVAQVCAREPIGNLPGYFYRVMVNIGRRMCEELARHGTPVEDPAAAGGSRRGGDLAAASAESDALPRLLAAARRDLLRRRRAELRQEIPACSPDPDRYRDVILAMVEAMLVGQGPASRAEINAVLTAAYRDWFDAPDAAPATTYQRRCRARESIRQMLAAVIGPDDPDHPIPGRAPAPRRPPGSGRSPHR